MANNALLIAGALGLVGVVTLAMSHGQQTTQGVTFAAPSDASVAAVESAGASETASVNALAVQRSQIASQTILGLAGLQEQLNLGTLAARSTDLQTTAAAATAATTAALQQSASVHQVDVAANVANYATMVSGEVANFSAQTTAQTAQTQSTNELTAADYQASLSATATQAASNNALTAALASIQAQLRAADINANAGIQEAASAGNAAVAVANNQTTQAQAAAGAQKTSSFWNFLGQAAGAVTSVFTGGASGAKLPAPSTSAPGVTYA